MHDTRPAAESIAGELFPERHARAMQAASPVDVGLAAIQAHDPGFELEQFTQQVQRVFFMVQQAWSERKPETSRQVMADGLWQEQRDQIQGYVDGHRRNMLDYLAVSNIWPVAAHSDSRFDTITVRIVAACTDYDVDDQTGHVVRGDRQIQQWEEDWTFQRSSQAQTKTGGTTLGPSAPTAGLRSMSTWRAPAATARPSSCPATTTGCWRGFPRWASRRWAGRRWAGRRWAGRRGLAGAKRRRAPAAPGPSPAPRLGAPSQASPGRRT